MNDLEKKGPQSPAPMTDPFAQFRSEMDRLFNSFFGDRPSGGLSALNAAAGGAMVTPTTDVAENDAAVTLTIELPGMSEEDVEVTVRDGQLLLTGEKRFEHKSDTDNLHRVERRYGSVRRSFTLPESVDAEAISAHFDKGVLTITLPKKPEAATQPRKISISKKD